MITGETMARPKEQYVIRVLAIHDRRIAEGNPIPSKHIAADLAAEGITHSQVINSLKRHGRVPVRVRKQSKHVRTEGARYARLSMLVHMALTGGNYTDVHKILAQDHQTATQWCKRNHPELHALLVSNRGKKPS